VLHTEKNRPFEVDYNRTEGTLQQASSFERSTGIFFLC